MKYLMMLLAVIVLAGCNEKKQVEGSSANNEQTVLRRDDFKDTMSLGPSSKDFLSKVAETNGIPELKESEHIVPKETLSQTIETFRITYVSTKEITIGGRKLWAGKDFSEKDIIEWDESISIQAITVRSNTTGDSFRISSRDFPKGQNTMAYIRQNFSSTKGQSSFAKVHYMINDTLQIHSSLKMDFEHYFVVYCNGKQPFILGAINDSTILVSYSDLCSYEDVKLNGSTTFHLGFKNKLTNTETPITEEFIIKYIQ